MSGFHPKDLINEVRIRPGIYNRDELMHPKRDHKHQLWMEVAERLTPPEDWESYTDVEKEARMDEISTKWKHLKDHFYREIKLQEAGEAHKKRKYIYFDDLEFMRPFVGFKLMAPGKRNIRKSLEDNNEDFVENDPDEDIDMDAFLKSTEHVEEDGEYKMEPEDSPSPAEETTATSTKLTRIVKPLAKDQPQQKANSGSTAVRSSLSVNKSCNNIVKRPNSTATNSHFKIRDGDISFSLSLVPTLRKFSDGLKLRAKIDILEVLQKHIDEAESQSAGNRPKRDNISTTTQNADIDDDMPEDHLDEYDETIIKHERDDPLNGVHGNSKAWW